MKTLSKLLFTCFMASSLIFTSCGKDDEPAPAAQSGFSQNRKVIEANETVTFTNTSTNATRYEWDFGNGKTSTEQNPTINYTSKGTYTVKLTAYNSENAANTTTSVVKVGERFITTVSVIKIDFLGDNGSPWDFSDGPDLKLNVGRSSLSNWEYSYPLQNDVTQAQLPLIRTLNPEIKVTNESWDFAIYDIDGASNDDFMFGGSGNPVSIAKDYNTGKGGITVIEPGYEMNLTFEVK